MVRVGRLSLLLIRQDLLHPSDLAVFEPHFDPAGMESGGCEDILYDPDRSVAGSLVFFQDDRDALSGSNVTAILAVHICSVYSSNAGVPILACLMPSWKPAAHAASTAGKFDLKTALAQFFEQKLPVVPLDLYHTVFYRAPGPALCLELSFKFL